MICLFCHLYIHKVWGEVLFYALKSIDFIGAGNYAKASVSAGAIFIYVIAAYTILDCANMVIKEIYKLGENAIAKLKEKGYLK